MSTVMLKTHLIVAGMHEEYSVKWTGRIIDAKPLFRNNMPVFVLISSEHRTELNTIDMKRIEECAKRMTNPHGKKAIATDKTEIYLLEKDGNQKYMGQVIHNHIKEYRQMYDSFEKV